LSHRPAQLSGILRSVLALHALQIPPNTAKVVSIVQVKVSADLSYADVYLSAIEGVEPAIKFLKEKVPEIRSELASTQKLHRIPALRFHKDTTGEEGAKIDKLLSTL
jgi:ribosome-binding factor A